jgi:hypothetical protein
MCNAIKDLQQWDLGTLLSHEDIRHENVVVVKFRKVPRSDGRFPRGFRIFCRESRRDERPNEILDGFEDSLAYSD